MTIELPHMNLFERAAEAIRKEEYSSALADLKWLHQHSSGSPMFRAFRAVPFLEVWRYLASVYPPALHALKDALAEWECEAKTQPPDEGRASDIRRYATVIDEIEADLRAADIPLS